VGQEGLREVRQEVHEVVLREVREGAQRLEVLLEGRLVPRAGVQDREGVLPQPEALGAALPVRGVAWAAAVGAALEVFEQVGVNFELGREAALELVLVVALVELFFGCCAGAVELSPPRAVGIHRLMEGLKSLLLLPVVVN